jgi:GNAT superfamily N-acetyltransferase
MDSLRKMTGSDIPAGLRLCRASGWNQLETDWRLFLELSPTGCYVAMQDDGEVIGTVATICYERRFSWIAMVLVDPRVRGQGAGTRLFEAALDLLSGMPCIRLDATPAGARIYREFGFEEECGMSRMKAVVKAPAFIQSPRVRRMEPTDFAGVCSLDRHVFGADRSPLLRANFERAPDYAWVAVAGSRIDGFSLGRHGHNCEHLGPVVSHDQGTARELVSTCLVFQEDRPFLMDAPRSSPEWIEWLASKGFAEERPFKRMSRGANQYPGEPDRQFAAFGPECG